WEFPSLNGTLSAQEVLQWLRAHGVDADPPIEAASKKHVFTHVEWKMQAFFAECSAAVPGFEWVTLQQLDDEITLPAAFAKFRKVLQR
ncbi:MAG: NUDIX domain-containing protein, partial [Clostridia bacterium]|nr:NUDIX domain-containing protein [Clostridia bacterium]